MRSRLGHRFACQPITLDFLIQIRARHVERARRLRYVPVELTQLGEQERALGGVLELLERLALEERAEPRLLGIARPDQPRDVLGGDARAGRENEQTLYSVS